MNKLVVCVFIFLASVSQARTLEAFRCVAQDTTKPGTDWKTIFEYPHRIDPFAKEAFLYGYSTNNDGWQGWSVIFDFSQFVETESQILFGGPADGKLGGVRIELDKATYIARFCVYKGSDFLESTCSEGMSGSGFGVYHDVKDTASCSSVRSRYDRQNFLTFDSATCRAVSVVQITEDGRVNEKSESERESFLLSSLRSRDTVETYCGPECEPPGIRITYRVGERSSSNEVFLMHASGRRVMQVHFENKKYRLIEFYDSGYSVETGKCDFAMSRSGL